ncbi:MAG: hypothetical protein DMF91_20285 [Acidobacteria bacterium]|nr:MAG: hypothetical protein DMF91_20285 [Acidobacteriota bacterium]
MDVRVDELFQQRESKLLEWVFSDRNCLKSSDACRQMREGFARRLLLMQASRRVISQVLSPSRRRKLSLDECADLNVHLNSFYAQLASAMDNLASVLQYEFAIAGFVGDEDAKIRERCDLFDPDFQRGLSRAFPRLFSSLGRRMLWAMELREYRDPRRQRLPLYVVPGLVDEDGTAALSDFKSELTAAMRSCDFEAYREKLRQVQQVGSYLPLLATAGPDAIQLRPLPDQLYQDEDEFLGTAESIFSALGVSNREDR